MSCVTKQTNEQMLLQGFHLFHPYSLIMSKKAINNEFRIFKNELKEAVKSRIEDRKRMKKVRSLMKKCGVELKKVLKKVAPEKVKVVKAKPTKLVRLSYCSSVADKARQVNLDVNGVCISVFEVEAC